METVDNAIELASIDDVDRLAERIPDNWTLCKLFEDHRRACEAETMVAQTIQAARINAKEHGEPFSFKGGGVKTSSGGGLVDNRTAYGWLVREGWFVEDERQGRTVIFPTKKLIAKLDGFLGNPVATPSPPRRQRRNVMALESLLHKYVMRAGPIHHALTECGQFVYAASETTRDWSKVICPDCKAKQATEPKAAPASDEG